MSSRFIWVSCSCSNYSKVIKKLYNLDINIYECNYNNKELNLRIEKKDYKKIHKYLPTLNIKVNKVIGIDLFHNIIKKYYYFLISIIVGILVLYLSSHLIVSVKVIHSKKEIRDLVIRALEDEGINRLTWKKDYKDINKIKNKILNKYQNKIEWIEIETNGMNYIVRVEERIITQEKKNLSSCDVVATKNGVITDIKNIKGEALVTRGSYVNKGDVLITGLINYNDQTKNVVCANGSIKAEVWYQVNVSMPLKYNDIKKTGKSRYNIVIDDGIKKHFILRSRLNNYKSIFTKLISLPNINIYLSKDQEIIKNSKIYSDDEAIQKAILLAIKKINIQKKDRDRILTQKVLKKEVNDSTISLEMFFAVEEEIGKIKETKVDRKE